MLAFWSLGTDIPIQKGLGCSWKPRRGSVWMTRPHSTVEKCTTGMACQTGHLQAFEKLKTGVLQRSAVKEKKEQKEFHIWKSSLLAFNMWMFECFLKRPQTSHSGELPRGQDGAGSLKVSVPAGPSVAVAPSNFQSGGWAISCKI